VVIKKPNRYKKDVDMSFFDGLQNVIKGLAKNIASDNERQANYADKKLNNGNFTNSQRSSIQDKIDDKRYQAARLKEFSKSENKDW